MKRIFNGIKLNSGWKKIKLKEFNDFYLIAIKKGKNSRKSTLDKDCIRKIRFEIAIDSGKKKKYLLYSSQIEVDFKNISSRDVEFNEISAFTKVLGCPSTFYIRAISMTGESSTVTEGSSSVEVYLNELRLR